MKKVIATVLASSLMMAFTAVYAADSMAKDNMGNDSMQKERAMSHDNIGKDGMKKKK
ncbi:pentapeptide MXKDX repeat protein [Edwardsiella ictaluri]